MFSRLLAEGGLVDAARLLHPDAEGMFTWWPYWRNLRQKNVGWRIDYVLVAQSLQERIRSAHVMHEFGTSDHAPLAVDLDWP